MKFGVFDHVDASGRNPGQQLEERLQLVEIYDRSPIFAYHIAEHHGTPLGLAPSPNLLIAAASQRSKRLRLGPMVLLLPLYPPVRLIQEIAMLDHLTGGRLELGVGRGVSPIEVGFFGLDPAVGVAQFDEALEVILKGLAADELNHTGAFYTFDRVPMILKPVQRPHPPLWYGVNRNESVAKVADRAMSMMLNGPAERARTLVAGYRAHWQTLGRDADRLPFLALSRHLVIAERSAEAKAMAQRAYRPWRRHIEQLWKARGVPFPLALPAEFDELAAMGLGFAGSPAEARHFVEREIATAGITYFCARMCFGDMRHEEAAASAELYAREVVAPLTTV